MSGFYTDDKNKFNIEKCLLMHYEQTSYCIIEHDVEHTCCYVSTITLLPLSWKMRYLGHLVMSPRKYTVIRQTASIKSQKQRSTQSKQGVLHKGCNLNQQANKRKS